MTRVAALLLCALAAAGCGRRDAPRAAEGPWNLVLVVVDTLRADRLGLYGHPRPTSPELDARADGWFVFENAQSAAPWTAPALISLMTSLYPAVHGVRDFPNPGALPAEAETLAEILKRHGWATAAFTEGGYAKADFGLGRGFDVFPRQPGDDDSHWSNELDTSRLAGNLDRTLAWLRARDAQSAPPFFLLFHTYEPHVPYRAPEEYVRRFRPRYDEAVERGRLAAAVERWNRTRQLTRDELLTLQVHLQHCRLAGGPRLVDGRALHRAVQRAGLDRKDLPDEEPFVRWVSDLYDAEIAYTDAQLARLWDALDAPGLRERTLVVLVSDHGEGLGEHRHFDHGIVLHEELLRVPLLMRLPDPGLAPRRIPELVRLVDLAPTLLDLLGVAERPAAAQGRSFAPLLRATGALAPEPSFSHGRSNFPGETDTLLSVRDARWRLLLDTATGQTRLFDLASDPGETTDVSASHPLETTRLLETLTVQQQRDAALRARMGAGAQAPALAPDVRKELESLGYLEDGG